MRKANHSTVPQGWDRLRESDQDGSFGFGSSRDQWTQRARSHAFLAEHAACIVGLLRGWNARQLVSVGVGTAMLEYLVKSAAPDVVLRCGDFAPHSIERLRSLFPECDSIETMDLRDPTWATDPSDVLLLNRVDTELNDLEWKEVFRRLHRSQIERIIFIPCELLTASLAVHELRGLATAVRRRRRLARAGYMRTEARLLELFADLYTRTLCHSREDFPSGPWSGYRTEGRAVTAVRRSPTAEGLLEVGAEHGQMTSCRCAQDHPDSLHGVLRDHGPSTSSLRCSSSSCCQRLGSG